MLHQHWQQAQHPLAKGSQTEWPLLDTSMADASNPHLEHLLCRYLPPLPLLLLLTAAH
jgi:hypothetical protein